MPYYDYKNLSDEQKATYRTLSILENSAVMEARRVAERAAFSEQQKKDAENDRLLAWHRQQWAAEIAKENEERRKQSAAGFEADLRQRFFEGNQFASESDFQKILPKLRENAMLANVDSSDRTEELIRESGSYSQM